MNSFDILEELGNLDDDILLLAETDPPKRPRLLPRAMRYAAAACLAVTLMVTTWFAVDVAAGGEVLRWTVRYREDRVTYLFKGGTELDGPLPLYEPGWLPAGYTLFLENWGIMDDRSMTYRAADDTNYIGFDYQYISDRMSMNFHSLEEGTYKHRTVDISGMPGDLYFNLEYGGCMLIWIDKDERIVFRLNFPKDDPDTALRIARSVGLTQ